MVSQKSKRLGTYVSNLFSNGRSAFSGEEAEKALGLNHTSFLQSALRLKKKGQLYAPRSGYYVIIPQQFQSWGAPPPSWFVDGLMRHENRPYYVGLLKAAEIHGAAHQAVMEFQVVTNTPLPKLQAGRSLIVFYFRRDLEGIASAVQEHKTDTGTMRVASPELTALDLLRYPYAAGGIDNILTVLGELGPKIDGARLAILCPKFERAVRQRLGYLLARTGQSQAAEVLHASLSHERVFGWVELDPAIRTGDPDLVPAPTARDPKWRVIVRRQPEADEE